MVMMMCSCSSSIITSSILSLSVIVITTISMTNLVGVYADCTYQSKASTFQIEVKEATNSDTDIYLQPKASINKYVRANDYVVS